MAAVDRCDTLPGIPRLWQRGDWASREGLSFFLLIFDEVVVGGGGGGQNTGTV